MELYELKAEKLNLLCWMPERASMHHCEIQERVLKEDGWRPQMLIPGKAQAGHYS